MNKNHSLFAGLFIAMAVGVDVLAADQSALWMESKTRASLVVTDEQGRRLGVDPVSQKTLQEIPDSSCEADFIDDPYSGEKNVEVYERLTMSPVKPGRYTIRLRGLRDGPYEVTISALSREGNSVPYKKLEGLISKDQVRTFLMKYEDHAETPMTIIENHKK